MTTARENQTTGLTNGRAANWASEVEFSPYRALSRRQMTFSFCLLNQPITSARREVKDSRRSGMSQSCFFWDEIGQAKSVDIRSESAKVDEVRTELLRDITRSL